MAGCVDASLIVRILDGHSAALAVWERLVHSGGDLIAPNLLHYEVANVLHQQQRAKKISAETAQDGLRRVMNLPHRAVWRYAAALPGIGDRPRPAAAGDV